MASLTVLLFYLATLPLQTVHNHSPRLLLIFNLRSSTRWLKLKLYFLNG